MKEEISRIAIENILDDKFTSNALYDIPMSTTLIGYPIDLFDQGRKTPAIRKRYLLVLSINQSRKWAIQIKYWNLTASE